MGSQRVGHNWATEQQPVFRSSNLLPKSHMVIPFNFWGTEICFPQQMNHLTFLRAMYKGSNFSTSSSTLASFSFFLGGEDINQPSECKVLLHCSFEVHFPNSEWIWAFLPFYLAVRLYYFVLSWWFQRAEEMKTDMCNLRLLSVEAFLPQWLRGWCVRAICTFRACLSYREPPCPRSQPSEGNHIQWLLKVMYKYLDIWP